MQRRVIGQRLFCEWRSDICSRFDCRRVRHASCVVVSVQSEKEKHAQEKERERKTHTKTTQQRKRSADAEHTQTHAHKWHTSRQFKRIRMNTSPELDGGMGDDTDCNLFGTCCVQRSCGNFRFFTKVVEGEKYSQFHQFLCACPTTVARLCRKRRGPFAETSTAPSTFTPPPLPPC